MAYREINPQPATHRERAALRYGAPIRQVPGAVMWQQPRRSLRPYLSAMGLGVAAACVILILEYSL